MIFQLKLSHNAILQLQFKFNILTELFNLEYVESVGLHMALLIINIQYYFDIPSSYHITIVYIPSWHKSLLPVHFSDT